jgi:ATP-dependent RNA helicase RhlE
VIVATPGRLLDHMQYPYVRFDGLEVLVLDEADRMLDMGFLPDIRRVLKQLPVKRQTLFFSATMPAPIVKLSHEMLARPAAINLERKSRRRRRHHAGRVYPVAQELKRRSSWSCCAAATSGAPSSSAAPSTGQPAGRRAGQGGDPLGAHPRQPQPDRAHRGAGGFKSGKYRVLVATDIVARGIDVEALEHVVNFDVPHVPEDYIHRVGRTARAEATGDAYTLVSPDEERDLKAIERAIGKQLPRVRCRGFDYRARPAERFEVPLAERIAEIRKRKAEERARAREKADTARAPARPRSSA